MLPSLRRIRREAEEVGWFDTVTVVDEHFFDRDYFHLVKPTLHMRGFGYWRWKSYVVKRKLYEMNKDDILLYLDAGSSLNVYGTKRFNEYLNLISDNDSGMLFFEQTGIKERAWTKMDLLAYAKYESNDDQLWAGGFMLRKTPSTIQFLNEWYDICNNHFELITDSPSKLPNDVTFVEHRHDQSAFSVIGRKFAAVVLPICETFTTDDYNIALRDYPFWATRKREFTWWGMKKMGLKKRFPKLFGNLY